MTYERKIKLHLMFPDKYKCPDEWLLCEELLGNFGKIKYDVDVYINDKFMYRYNKKLNNCFWLSRNHIWLAFEKEFNIEYLEIQEITTLYIQYKYNIKILPTRISVNQ